MEEGIDRIIEEAEQAAARISSLENRLDRVLHLLYQEKNPAEKAKLAPEEASFTWTAREPDISTSELADGMGDAGGFYLLAKQKADEIRSSLDELETRMRRVSRQTESVIQLQLTLASLERKSAEAKSASDNFANMAKKAGELEKRLGDVENATIGASKSMEDILSKASTLEIRLQRINGSLPALVTAEERMDSLEARMNEIQGAETRLMKLQSELKELEGGLEGKLSSVQDASRTVESLIEAKNSANARMDQITKQADKAQSALKQTLELDQRFAGMKQTQTSLEEKLEKLEISLGGVTLAGETAERLNTNISHARMDLERLEAKSGIVGMLEERMKSLSSQLDSLRDIEERKSKSEDDSRALMRELLATRDRAEELAERMETAETRLSSALNLERNLSLMEDKVFHMIKSLERIDEKERIIRTAQEKIDMLATLIEDAESKINRLM